MRKFIAIYILILLTVNLYSDAFSDWKKKQSQAFAAFKQDEDSAFRAFLEKEWQEIYFALLFKEEEIRKEEKVLKEALSDFINIVRNSVKGGRKKE